MFGTRATIRSNPQPTPRSFIITTLYGCSRSLLWVIVILLPHKLSMIYNTNLLVYILKKSKHTTSLLHQAVLTLMKTSKVTTSIVSLTPNHSINICSSSEPKDNVLVVSKGSTAKGKPILIGSHLSQIMDPIGISLHYLRPHPHLDTKFTLPLYSQGRFNKLDDTSNQHVKVNICVLPTYVFVGDIHQL